MSRPGAADLERLLAARGDGDAAAVLAAALGAPAPPPAGRRRLLAPLARALRQRPRDAQLRAARGRLLLRLGRVEEAAAELERATRLAPGRSEPRLWLGAALLLAGDNAAAARELDARLAVAPQDGAARTLRAAAAAGAGDEVRARRDAQKAVATSAPAVAAGARALLGLLKTRAGRLQAALSDFDAALALDPGAAWLLGLRACARRRAGDARGAKADFDAAARREPSAWLLAERAGLRESQGDGPGALRDLDAALRRAGPAAELLQRRANLLAAAGRLPQAAADARRALAAPDGAKALPFAALLVRDLAARGRHALALPLARLVLRAAPRDPAAAEALVAALTAAGRSREAAALLKRAGLSAPGELEASSGARTLAAAGRLTEAERAARAALAARPGAAALLILVEVLLRRGRAGEASAALARERPRLPPPAGPGDLARRYRLAVLAADPLAAERAGEALLDATRETRYVEILSRPFFVGEFDFMALPATFVDALFAALDARAVAAPRSPWPRFLRLALCALTGATGKRDTRAADCAALARPPAARYGWMRGLTGQWRLIDARDYPGAERDFRAAAKASKPGDWTAWCFLGETLLCRGLEAPAFAALAEARRVAPASSAADALAWEGELRLWRGRPAAARALLDKAIRLGALYADGWKGAVLALEGRHAQALPTLERAIARTPHDAESRTWKAEALLRLGRPAEALAAADEALARLRRYSGFHLLAVRGLALAALGDEKGAFDAHCRMPAEVLEFVRAKTPAARGKGPPARAAALDAVLRLSRGVRRGGHETAVWLR